MAAVYNYDTRALNPTLHIDVAQMGKRKMWNPKVVFLFQHFLFGIVFICEDKIVTK